jgi:hypothetical protein
MQKPFQSDCKLIELPNKIIIKRDCTGINYDQFFEIICLGLFSLFTFVFIINSLKLYYFIYLILIFIVISLYYLVKPEYLLTGNQRKYVELFIGILIVIISTIIIILKSNLLFSLVLIVALILLFIFSMASGISLGLIIFWFFRFRGIVEYRIDKALQEINILKIIEHKDLQHIKTLLTFPLAHLKSIDFKETFSGLLLYFTFETQNNKEKKVKIYDSTHKNDAKFMIQLKNKLLEFVQDLK